MKKIDFSVTGGFPLTQDRLAFLQAAYEECLNAIAAIGGAAGMGLVPVVLSGMAVSGGGNTVASGWVFYNNELVRFTGGTVAPAGGDVALVAIATATTSVAYDRGGSHPVILDTTATLTTGALVTNPTHFPVNALTKWYTTDPVVAAELLTITAELSAIYDAWPVAGTPSYTPFGGTFAIGSCPYNRCQIIGSTVIWQAQLLGCTTGSGLNNVRLEPPANFFSSGLEWGNPGMVYYQDYDHGGAPIRLKCVLANSGGFPFLDIGDPAGAFSAASGYNFYINIIGETS